MRKSKDTIIKKESDKNEKDEKNDKQKQARDEKLRTYYYWYVETFLQSIHFHEFAKRVNKYNWLKESLQNVFTKDHTVQSSVYYGSIWRYEVLDNLKFYITPKKTENIVTVFKIDRTHSLGRDRSAEFHTTFAFLYSAEENGRIEHQYICLGPTFQSADGEYRRSFMTYKQFRYIMSQYPELVTTVSDQIIKWMDQKKMSISIESFFPRFMQSKLNYPKIQKDFMEKLDTDRITIDIYVAVWIIEFKRHIDKTQENHLVPGYNEALFSSDDEKFYSQKIQNLPGVSDLTFTSRMQQVMPYPGKKYYPAACGQKLIPLRIKDVEECENIKHAPWREMYISSLVGDLVINGVSPSFPIFVDWFFISTNSPNIWDNKVSHQKLDHSMVATDIIHKLEAARKSTYEFGEKGDEYYVTYQMQGMSEAIEVPIDYAEKELILAPVTLCSLVEHVGRTFADVIPLMDKPGYKEIGPIFKDVRVFAKYLFEYIYAIYNMNKHLHLIHTDLHLNNITFYSVRPYYRNRYDPIDVTPLIPNAHILYDLGDENAGEATAGDDVYVFPHYGRYAMIIDFSRGILGREQLKKDFPEHTVDQIISNQRKRLFRTISRELPDFAKSHANELEALLLQNFDLAFKLYTALDTYKLTRGMLNYTSQSMFKIGLSPEVTKLLQHVHDMALHVLTIDVQKAFRREIVEYDLPNLRILRECFSAFTLDKFDQKAARRDDPNTRVNIIDVYQTRNPLKYDIRKYNNFPPVVSFDYIVDHNIPLDLSGLKNVQKHIKYLKTNPIKKVYELAAEVRAERPIRRGTPSPPTDKHDNSKDVKDAKNVKDADESEEPKKEVHLEEGDQASDILSSSSI